MTVFYEIRGEQAQVRLEAAALALEAFGIQATLLEGYDDTSVYLLHFNCTDDAVLPASPKGAKVWRFTRLTP